MYVLSSCAFSCLLFFSYLQPLYNQFINQENIAKNEFKNERFFSINLDLSL